MLFFFQVFLSRIKGKWYYHVGYHKSKSIINDKTFNLHAPTSNGFRACHSFSRQLMKHEDYLERMKKSHSLASGMPRGEMRGWDELGDWDWHIYTAMYGTGNE